MESEKKFFANDDASCPFYIKSDAQRITCEGLVEDSYINQFFRRGNDRKIHKETFCDVKYENCEIFQMLKRYYDEE